MDNLLLALTRIDRTPAEDMAIAEQASNIPDWDAVYALCRDNRVAPWVFQELQRLGLEATLPATALSAFQQQTDTVRRDNSARLRVGLAVLAQMRSEGIDVLVLKGVANGATVYDNPCYKRMNDIDILVPRAQIPALMSLYERCGFVGIAERVGGDPERQLEVTNHLPPYVNRDVSCMFGTQWSFRSPALGHSFDMEAIWTRSEPLELDGVALHILGPEDAVHHAALHLERFRTGARDVMDIHNLLFRHRDRFDWTLFLEEVDRCGTHHDVYYALTFAHAHRPMASVAEALDALRPRVHRSIVDLAAWRTRSDAVLLRICSRQFSTIEKAVSAFNATTVLREKLPFFLLGWRSIFWPPLTDAMKISAYVEPTPLNVVRARAVAPIRLMSAIATEIGWHLLLGLGLKSFFDLGRAALPGGSSVDLDAYATRLGMEPAQLRAVYERIQ